MSAFDFNSITTVAYDFLLSQAFCTLPIDPLSFSTSSFFVMSYQEISRRTGKAMSDFTCDGLFHDGFIAKGIRKGYSVILYNDEVCPQRKRFTVFHELGHLFLDHRAHNAQEEIEANFFASQCIAPNALIHELRRWGQTLSLDLLMGTFGISASAAKKKMRYFSEYPNHHRNVLDACIVSRFNGALKVPGLEALHAQNFRTLAKLEEEYFFSAL